MSVDKGPLEDIQEIVSTQVALSPEEQVIANKITAHVKALVRPEVRKELEVEYIKHRTEFETSLSEQNKATIAAALKDWEEKQKPLDSADIATLLRQEYTEFTFDVPIRGGEPKTFTLQELPQALELKFMKMLKTKLVPVIKELASTGFSIEMSESAIDQFQKILDSAPGVLSSVTELIPMCLDPWEEDDEITADWVRAHMSSYRIQTVLIGQIEVNKIRDFFSNGYRISKNLR